MISNFLKFIFVNLEIIAMKRKMFLMILSIVFIIGCTEDEKVQPLNTDSHNTIKGNDLFGLKSLPSVDQESDIIVYGSSMHGINTEFNIYADFKNSSGNYVSVNDFSINGISPNYESSIGAYSYSTELTSTELNLFSDSITIDVNDSPFGNYEFKIYNPELISITGILQNGINILDSASHVVGQNGDITITWNSDPNYEEDLLLLLIPRPYCFDGDQRCDLENLSTVQDVISNTGSYTISDDFMENFENIDSAPNTDGFDLILGVANQDIIEHEVDIETVITVFSYDNYGLLIVD